MSARIVAQSENEMAKIDFMYSIVPRDGDLSWSQYDFNLYYSKLQGKNLDYDIYLKYRNQNFDFFNTAKGLNMEEPNALHRIGTGGSFSLNLSQTWDLNADFSTFISSDFKDQFNTSDIQYFGKVLLGAKLWSKLPNHGVKIGLGYGILKDEPVFHPVVSFSHTLFNGFYLELGFPQSAIYYKLNDRQEVKTGATIIGEYTYIHSSLNSDTDLPYGKGRLVQHSIDYSIEYTYKIQPPWHAVIKVGYLGNNDTYITDNTKNELYNLTTEGAVYFSMGLTFNINN